MTDMIVTVPGWLIASVKFGSPIMLVVLVFWWDARSNGGVYLAVPAFTIAALFLVIGYYIGLMVGM